MKRYLLIDMSILRKALPEQARVPVSAELKVEFTNPLDVFANDREYLAKVGSHDEDMKLGTANLVLESDKVYADVSFLPYLEEFYERYPQFAPKFVAMNTIATNGNAVDAIIVKWLEIR